MTNDSEECIKFLEQDLRLELPTSAGGGILDENLGVID